MKILKHYIPIWFVFWLPIASQTQTTTDSLSLQSLVTKALQKNTGLKNAQLEIEKSEEVKSHIKHTFIPTLELAGRYAYTSGSLNMRTKESPINIPGASLPPIIPGFPAITLPPTSISIPALDQSIDFKGSLWMGGLTAKWTLFTGFKAANLSKAMTHKIEAQKHLFTQEEANLISEISAIYDKIALLAQTQKVLDIQTQRLVKETQVATKALEQGLITKHEFQKIEIAQLTIESKSLEFEGSKELLYLKLHQLTGVDIVQLETITVNINVRLNDVATGKTYLDRPELNALEEAAIATEYKYKSEISGYLPKVQAFASHQYLGLTNGELGSLAYKEISAYPVNMVGVGVKWELFDGFHTKGERQKIKIEMEQNQNRKEEVTELLELNYKNCVSQFYNLSAQAKLKNKQLQSAKKSVEISYKEYQNGLVQLSDFLESQSNYTTATLAYYTTICDQRNSAIELLKATGSLQIDKL